MPRDPDAFLAPAISPVVAVNVDNRDSLPACESLTTWRHHSGHGDYRGSDASGVKRRFGLAFSRL